MNNTIVLYESKYGFTERYAKWIAEALSCPVYKRRSFSPQDLADYEIILYGGGLYAGSVSGIKLITGNWPLIRSKKVILFTCGLADPDDPSNASNIRETLSKMLSPEMMQSIHLFHLRGGIDYSKLNFVHKAMMAMLHKMLLKENARSPKKENELILETYGKQIDFSDPKSIQPLLDHVSSLCRTDI